MASNISFPPIFIILLILTSFLEFPPAECKYTGFTTNLIRHNYPQKAVFDFSEVSSSKSEYFEWLAKAVNRSFSRAAYFNHIISKKSSSQKKKIIDLPLTRIDADFTIEVGIGTPPVKINAILDTGSDLAWTQCKPCIHCFLTDEVLFEPNKSSTYQQLSCESQQCQSLPDHSCHKLNKCSYQLSYEKRKFLQHPQSKGDLAVDTFTFHSSDGMNVSFPNTAFGCGHDNSGNFNESVSGFIGLGRGALSIVNQFSSTISKKFSYCLVPFYNPAKSKISFGVNALLPGSKAVSTPMLKSPAGMETFYFITLEGISLGKGNGSENKNINAFKSHGSQPTVEHQGNMIIIDSGTLLTFLPEDIYGELKLTLLRTIKAQPIIDERGNFDLCYQKESDLKFPDLVFHFRNADVLISQENAFIEAGDGVVCLIMLAAEDEIAIFGNLSQVNYLIEYDIANEKLSFLPTDCSKKGQK